MFLATTTPRFEKNFASWFRDESDVGPFTFTFVNGPPLKEVMDGGKFRVRIQPYGNDTRNYSATSTLTFSDGTFVGSGGGSGFSL